TSRGSSSGPWPDDRGNLEMAMAGEPRCDSWGTRVPIDWKDRGERASETSAPRHASAMCHHWGDTPIHKMSAVLRIHEGMRYPRNCQPRQILSFGSQTGRAPTQSVLNFRLARLA